MLNESPGYEPTIDTPKFFDHDFIDYDQIPTQTCANSELPTEKPKSKFAKKISDVSVKTLNYKNKDN